MTMAPNRYIHYGTRSGVEKVLPGVKIKVLGPPDLGQTDAIRRQRGSDEGEFWHFQSQSWHLQAAAAGSRPSPSTSDGPRLRAAVRTGGDESDRDEK